MTSWDEAASPEAKAALDRLAPTDREMLVTMGSDMIQADLQQIDDDIDVGLKLLPRMLRGPVKKVLGV